MQAMKTVIGIDYGTLSARAVMVDTETGEVLCSHQVAYPHGVMSGDLASTTDYEQALAELLRAMSDTPWCENIAGICVDATSLTLVPLGKDGKPLALHARYANAPHAQIKLWKYHAAQHQAGEALALAQEMREPFLGMTGGSLSCEWMLPKLLECRDEAPDIYAQLDLALDLCEYLTYRLTGEVVRSVSAMGFKCLWSQAHGLPSKAYLNRLRPGFAGEYMHLLRGTLKRPGEVAGRLSDEMADAYGLSRDIIVATGTLDGHTSLIALGALAEGDAALVIGTSNVLSTQARVLHEIPGICGVVQDGLTPGLFGYEAGQNCTGDMLSWYVRTMLPASVQIKADARGQNVHDYLCSLVKTPWTNPVSVADWWNGSRNVPCDLTLRGGMQGLSLATEPQDIYLAMLQAIACGTRELIEQFARHGVQINRVVAAGGITQKNPLLMQEYANILRRPVSVGKIAEGPALGSSMLAAIAAGIYATPEDAFAHMGVKDMCLYEPDEAHATAYEQLYARNHALRERLR